MQRSKYMEAGQLLDELDEELRKLELLSWGGSPESAARRWQIARSVLGNIAKGTEKFVEALWLESVDVQDLLASASEAKPVTLALAVPTIQGSVSRLRFMWRRWRDEREVVDLEKYQEIYGEAADLIATVEALRKSGGRSLFLPH